ncbi:ethylbenzene dehydrogenase-related protein [Nitrospina sp. 32_T5]|uniref:ethylbenzene dehydrogenase-related protein n=1 Tax=unclassified Nitrospina TaxID=2638683 RepID=UPI003F94A704
MKPNTRYPIPNPCSASKSIFALGLILAVTLLGWHGEPTFVLAHGGETHNEKPKAMPKEMKQGQSGHSHSGSAESGHSHSHGPGRSVTVGATVYKHMCIFCHGEDGNGGGKAMAYLYPWPRDFRKGVFKHRSTPTGSLPLDKDIFDTITKGIPGTAMPAWENALTEDETWSVVEYLKTFSNRFKNETPQKPVIPGPVPPSTRESIEAGHQIFQEMRCARCHGTDLKGDGPIADSLYDIWDHRVFVYDLTNPNTFKFGFDKEDIFMTLSTGIDGTPMKAYNHLTSKERWDLASFVHSRIQEDRYRKAKYEVTLKSEKVEGDIGIDPFSELWDPVPATNVHLIVLNARRDPITRVQFQSVTNGKQIAFRVQWEDPVPNRSSSRHQDFKDAVALEFALGDVLLHTHGHNEPFFGMGNREKPVNIWQWRADWQKEIETKEELEQATEGQGMDMDVMIFGGEVNPVESLNPFREVPIEEMNAEGFGTLTPQPKTKQNIRGKGLWKDGKWTVVFIRDIESLNKWDIQFNKKQPILIGFAVWDGLHKDRNGRKTVSMWQRLVLP